MTGDLRAAVVGGGIAGLASAASLAQAGAGPAFGEVGAGLGLTSNAMAALDAIGAGEAARAAGQEGHSAGFQDQSGRWLLRIPDNRAELRPITAVWGIHRQRLHEVLLRAAEGAELITGAEVSSVSPGSAEGDLATVTYRSGTGERVIESDLAVAADGVRSAVRALLFPDARSRYSGSTSWRAVIAGTDLDDHLVQAWGPGTEFGALPISGTEVYWYGYFRHPEGVV